MARPLCFLADSFFLYNRGTCQEVSPKRRSPTVQNAIAQGHACLKSFSLSPARLSFQCDDWMFWEATLTRRISFHMQLLFRSMWFCTCGNDTFLCTRYLQSCGFWHFFRPRSLHSPCNWCFKAIAGRICMQTVCATVAYRNAPRTFQKTKPYNIPLIIGMAMG